MKIQRIPIVHQLTSASCGVACTIATLRYFLGKKAPKDEKSLSKRLELDVEVGVEPDSIVEVVEGYGLTGKVSEDTPQSRLVAEFNQGSVCILQLQAWADGKGDHDYSKERDAGHYVILTGLPSDNEGKVLVMDPLSPDAYRSLTLKALRERWVGFIFDREVPRIAIFVSAGFKPRGEKKEKTDGDPLP